MREILFRGKRVDNGAWACGSLIVLPNGGATIQSYSDGDKYTVVAIDPATVGQFTGLLDKNGVRIFEGDTITPLYTTPTGKTTDDLDEYNSGCVEFCDGCAVLARKERNPHSLFDFLEYEKGEYICNYGNLFRPTSNRARVIVTGNIHDK